MALGKAVFAEAADLLEHALGELARDALCLHARDQPLAVLLDAARAAPRRHVAAQLIGLARRVVGGDDREPHHLLLEQRHAERLLEHRLEARVRVLDLLRARCGGAGTDAPCRRRSGPGARC